jgi:hypothetical protein
MEDHRKLVEETIPKSNPDDENFEFDKSLCEDLKGILDHRQKKDLETSFNHFTLQDINTPNQQEH